MYNQDLWMFQLQKACTKELSRYLKFQKFPSTIFFFPTANSGSAMIAALTLKRNALAVEKDDWNQERIRTGDQYWREILP